jgi:ubiquinone/menaquinone biosynthesis C-methylase UbiE
MPTLTSIRFGATCAVIFHGCQQPAGVLASCNKTMRLKLARAAQGSAEVLRPPLGTRLGATTPPLLSHAAIIMLLVAACTGCGNWTGGGFRADGAEMQRLRQVLALEAGKVVADVGAGKGQLTLALALEVSSNGRVFSTEIDATRLEQIRVAVLDAGLDNVTLVESRSHETGLPPNCCDTIVLRRVYHHLTDPKSINSSLLQSLRPGGVLAVIDFSPPFFWSRGLLGVPAEAVVTEVVGRGFELLKVINDWPGRGPLSSYCALFRKPLADPQVC